MITMKRKRTSSLISSQQIVSDSTSVTTTILYLPDDCWESIFKFIINDDDDNNNRRCFYPLNSSLQIKRTRTSPTYLEIPKYDHNNHYLNSLSLVSKQFLSITNRLRFSYTIYLNSTHSSLWHLFKKFTNLNSLNLSRYRCDLDKFLHEISRFPSLNITSLNISNQRTFPVNGMRAFSQNITTLTSLNCSKILLDNCHLLFIVNDFPLLKELKLGHSLINYNKIHYPLSKCRCIHLDLNRTYFLTDRHVAKLSLLLGNLVCINISECLMLTESALFSLVRNCPSLSEIKMERTCVGMNSNSLRDFSLSPQLKSLCLASCQFLRDKDIMLFASIFPNLQLLDLNSCNLISEGICEVLRRCYKLRHLNLANCSKVKLRGMNFVVPKLEVLNLSNTGVDDETLHVISKNCYGLLQLLLELCNHVTEDGVKHVIENCTQLKEVYLGFFHVSDKNWELFKRRGCLFC